MNVKIKASCVFFTAIVLILFLGLSAAFSDAPGVPSPGKRVPARTANKAAAVQKKAPVKKVSKPKAVQPAPSAPKLAAAVNPLNEAVALIKQERYQKALPFILCAIKGQPKNPDAWYWFGVWSDRTGNFSNAQKYYTKALDIDPNYPALSRIVVYPGDPYGKNPLWDSIRPPVIEAVYPLNEASVLLKEIDTTMYYHPETLSEQSFEVPVYLPPNP